MMQIKKKKQKKMCYNKKKKLKFQNHKNCLEEAQIKNKTNHFEKNKIDVDILKEN